MAEGCLRNRLIANKPAAIRVRQTPGNGEWSPALNSVKQVHGVRQMTLRVEDDPQ